MVILRSLDLTMGHNLFPRFSRNTSATMEWNGCQPLRILWPQANGLVERVNRSVLKVLKIANLEKKDLLTEFRKDLVAYRSTPHSGRIASWKASVGDSQPMEIGISRTSGRESSMPERRYKDFQLHLHGSSEGPIWYLFSVICFITYSVWFVLSGKGGM